MRIMLACAYGMSTNMLMQKMKTASKALGREDTIWAVGQERIRQELGNFDVLLLGPQIGYAVDDIRKMVGDQAPMGVIDAMDYGRLNGEKVLETADRLVKEFKG